jgi:hypothetical protein
MATACISSPWLTKAPSTHMMSGYATYQDLTTFPFSTGAAFLSGRALCYCFSAISRWQCGVINSTLFSCSSTYWVSRSRSVLPFCSP